MSGTGPAGGGSAIGCGRGSDRAEIDLDIRTLPGQTTDDIAGLVRDALGDPASEVEMETLIADPASASPADSPLFAALERGITARVPGARVLPFMIMGGTDAWFFRRQSAVACGAGLFRDRVPSGEFMRMFHGADERVDQESLRLSTELWRSLASDVLGSAAGWSGTR